MLYRPKSTLEQWRIFQAVVDYGGYAQAAEALNKSQSSLNHAVAKLQQMLGVQLLEVRGRKAFLTPEGEVMLRRSRQLSQQINELEALADKMECGWEPEITISVEIIYPKLDLYQVLAAFLPDSRGCRINIVDNVITGTEDAIRDHQADIVIAGHIPKGYLGEYLCSVELVPVCAAGHPLLAMEQVEPNELAQHLQVVIRDTSANPSETGGWLKAEQRWTVGNLHEAKDILLSGIGFCWLPAHVVEAEIAKGQLGLLNLKGASKKVINLNLVAPRPDSLGPASKALCNLLLATHGSSKTFE